MAAELKLVEKESVDRQKALEAALAQIDRAFGKGSAMKLGSKETMQVETISTGRSGSTSRSASAACRAAG
jgi:recombination protein RecA